MTAPIIIAETCPYCRRQRSPRDILHLSSFTICRNCWERHEKALAGLASGKYTGECSECGRSMDEIKAIQGDDDRGTRMVVHYENGIYRPMCLACDKLYVPKRADLYGNTNFWKKKGL